MRGGAIKEAPAGPKAWVASTKASKVSGTGPNNLWAARVTSRMSVWVHMTPLGMPVVPPV